MHDTGCINLIQIVELYLVFVHLGSSVSQKHGVSENSKYIFVISAKNTLGIDY